MTRNLDYPRMDRVGQSVPPKTHTGSYVGAAVDFQDCGPEIDCIVNAGIFAGTDVVASVSLEETNALVNEASDTSVYTPIIGATVPVTQDNAHHKKTFRNRGKRYVRAVVTITGTNPVVPIAVTLLANLHNITT